MRFAWPLTGRTEEMQTIEDAIASPTLAGIVVCGAAGVGKSRVAREALNTVASPRREVRWAVASSAGKTLPLGAFALWAPPTFTDNLQLVRGVIESLTSAPKGATVVVGVDDAHLLDDLSAFVLHQIVQRAAAKVVLTVRDGEPVPAAIQDVWKVGQFDRLDLQTLSQDETTTLLATTLAGPLDPTAARRLWTLTRGNPLYLRNIVEREIGDGCLAKQDGCWRWTGDPVLPPGLVELVDARMGALPTSVSEVIDALAVAEPIELSSLTRLTDSAAVEDADVRGLITLEDIGDRVDVRLAHPLYGEVRRNRARATRLRRLRGRIAAELASSDDRDDLQMVVRRATLSLESDTEPDAHLLAIAARGATWMWNLSLADRLADAAIRAGYGVEASLVRAYALSCLGRGREAEAVVADVPAERLTDLDRARLIFLRGINRLFTLADPEGAKQLVDDVPHTEVPEARSCIDAFRTVYSAAMGMPREADEFSKRYDWTHLPDIVAARVTAWALTVARGDSGRAAEAVASAEAGYPIPIRSFVVITDAHASALLLSGQIAQAHHPAEILRTRITITPGQDFVMYATALTGRVALGAGDLDTACSRLEHVIEYFSASGETYGWGYRCQIPRTTALAMRGRTDEASAALVALEKHRHPALQYLDYERSLARGWVAAAEGAVSAAISTVLSAAETARANGQFAAEVMCLQTATQFGDESCGPRLRELEAVVEGPRAGLVARFAEALSDGDAAELHAVSEDFERMGDLVAAVDAAAHAAVAYRRDDRKGSALTCSARADELAGRCGGASTPALRQASIQLPLSDRECEIAMLIGQGLSSRAIADRLTLSVRTVEGHIYRAMAKTGATTRDELAAMLPRHAGSSHD